jgi:peptidyl-prolyl cis-trans isomerase B (cyclophilin B)
MVQGGMVKDSKLPIRGEFTSNGFLNNLKHTYGVLSMARTSDKNSATSQFFMMTSTSPHLDGAYASFGGIISGFTILNQIESLSTNSNDAPLTKVVIESIEVDLKNYEPSPVIYYSK